MFGLSQILGFIDYLKSKLSQENFEVLFKALFTLAGIAIISAASILFISGKFEVRILNGSNFILCK